MKKIFIAVLAVAALASCSKEQIVNVDKGAVIGFDTFVENSTRANDLVVGNFDFGVYGTVTKGNSALIFNNQEVKTDFTYGNPVYWIADASYTFGAFAPYTDRAWSYELAGTDSTDKIYAENGTVTGSGDELPVIGAYVLQQGTNNGTSTDVDGNYVISVPSDATLIFSSVGYTTYSVAVNGRAQLDVMLKADAVMLDDVMVVAYGTAKKGTYTGAASVVKQDAIKDVPSVSFACS